MTSPIRSNQEIFLDFFLGVLLILWYILTVTFPAFHFSDFETKKSVAVALLVPPILLIMVVARVFKRKKLNGNLWTAFFMPETTGMVQSKTDQLVSLAVGWCGILIAPSLGSYSAEHLITDADFKTLFWMGSIPVVLLGSWVVYYGLNAQGISKFRTFYIVIGALLFWWSWAELLNMIEIASKAPWVFTEIPDRLKSLLGM